MTQLDAKSHARRSLKNAKPIGLIGVGLMGRALAGRLLAAGFQVLAFDLDPKRLEGIGDRHFQVAESPAEIASTCRRVFLSLPDTAVVDSVLGRLRASLTRGQIILDTTTGDPRGAIAHGQRLKARGVAYLDAGICGNSTQLQRGDVLVVVGGPGRAYDICLDLFASFARKSFYVGSWGQGMNMKLTTNLVLGLNRAVLAEALAFAQSWGLDQAKALAILRESSSYSRVMDIKGNKMLAKDYTPEARLGQHLKDVRLMLETAVRHGSRLPLTQVHSQLLDEAVASGLGELDNCAILEIFAPKRAGRRGR